MAKWKQVTNMQCKGVPCLNKYVGNIIQVIRTETFFQEATEETNSKACTGDNIEV